VPVVTIKGSFHLGGESGAGQPSGFRRDADSMQFEPGHASLRDRLERTAEVCRLTSIGSAKSLRGQRRTRAPLRGRTISRVRWPMIRAITGLLDVDMNSVQYFSSAEGDCEAAVAHDPTRRYSVRARSRRASAGGVGVRRRPRQQRRRLGQARE
jgi:hypothetical protein